MSEAKLNTRFQELLKLVVDSAQENWKYDLDAWLESGIDHFIERIRQRKAWCKEEGG
jgi:hypothetical protein